MIPITPSVVFDACHRKEVEKVKELLKQKPGLRDFTSPAEDGKTLLHIAVEGKCSGMINLLINLGADPNIKDNSGQTALDLMNRVKGGSLTLLGKMAKLSRELLDNPPQKENPLSRVKSARFFSAGKKHSIPPRRT